MFWLLKNYSFVFLAGHFQGLKYNLHSSAVAEPSTVDNSSGKEWFSFYLVVWHFVTDLMETALVIIGLDQVSFHSNQKNPCNVYQKIYI